MLSGNRRFRISWRQNTSSKLPKSYQLISTAWPFGQISQCWLAGNSVEGYFLKLILNPLLPLNKGKVKNLLGFFFRLLNSTACCETFLLHLKTHWWPLNGVPLGLEKHKISSLWSKHHLVVKFLFKIWLTDIWNYIRWIKDFFKWLIWCRQSFNCRQVKTTQFHL